MKSREIGLLVNPYQTIKSLWKATGVVSSNWYVLENELMMGEHSNTCQQTFSHKILMRGIQS